MYCEFDSRLARAHRLWLEPEDDGCWEAMVEEPEYDIEEDEEEEEE